MNDVNVVIDSDTTITPDRMADCIRETLTDIDHIRFALVETRHLLEHWPDADFRRRSLLSFARRALSHGAHLLIGKTVVMHFDRQFAESCDMLRGLKKIADNIAIESRSYRDNGRGGFWEVIADMRRKGERLPSDVAIVEYLGDTTRR